MTRPPYAPPPKYGPEVLGHDEWQRQQDAHERWLAWAENSYESNPGAAGESTDAQAAEPRDREQEQDEPDPELGQAVQDAVEGGEQTQEQDSNQQQEPEQEAEVEGTVKRFNVYVNDVATGKRIAQAKGVEVETYPGQSAEAAAVVVAAPKLADRLGTSLANLHAHLDRGEWEIEVKQPRGKPFQKGSDPRRVQEGGKQTTGGDKSPGARRKSKGGGASGSAGGGQGEASDGDQGEGQQGEGGGSSEPPPQAEWEQKLMDEAEELQKLLDRMNDAGKGAEQEGAETKPERDLVLLREKAEPLKGNAAVDEVVDLAQWANASGFGQTLQETAKGLDQLKGMIGTAFKGTAGELGAIREQLETLQQNGGARGGTASVDPAEVEKIARDVMKSAKIDLQAVAKAIEPLLPKTRPVEVRINGAPEGQVFDDHTHPAFEKVLQLAAQRLNVLLIGPTGCGKTHLARQVAKALFDGDDKRFGSVSCSTGMSEGVLLGWMLPVGEAGRFEYVRSEFVRIYEEGGLFLVDELDAADPNVMLVVNQALANGHLPVPQRRENPYAERHKDFVLIAAANTYGTGANRLYVGRNQLDEATLDRFRIGQVELDYDRELERALVPHTELCNRTWAIRDKLNALNTNRANLIRRIVSTRFLLDAYQIIEGQGWSVDDALAQLTTGWTPDERTRAGLSPGRDA